jgi:hypothetical protein
MGSKMPFREAVEEVWHGHKTAVGEATCRRVTYRSGQAAEAIVNQEAVRLEKEGFAETEAPERLVLSADGSFIHLTNGKWREVKGVAVGEFETERSAGGKEEGVRTRNLSYFTRSYRAREFEYFALAELARRGLDKAETVVAVTDGAEWLQSFIDYHCPEAVRIIDFAHALGYVAEAGRAIWGEGTEAFESWFARSRHQLKHLPPKSTLAELRLLQPKVKKDEQAAALDGAQLYLQRRLDMIDYPYFQRRGYPIGSGSVESAHKQVVQRRFKQAGMRWAPQNVDPLLALRDLICNKRWSEGWDHIIDYHWQQRHHIVRQRKEEERSKPSAAVTFPMLRATGLLAPAADLDDIAPVKEKPKKKPEDHPWRKNKWPTKESWRWNKSRQQN